MTADRLPWCRACGSKRLKRRTLSHRQGADSQLSAAAPASSPTRCHGHSVDDVGVGGGDGECGVGGGGGVACTLTVHTAVDEEQCVAGSLVHLARPALKR